MSHKEQYSPSPIKTFRRFCFLIAFSCDPRRRIRRSCSMRRAREKERNAERERERERAVKQTIVSVVSCKRIRNRQVQLHVAKLQKCVHVAQTQRPSCKAHRTHRFHLVKLQPRAHVFLHHDGAWARNDSEENRRRSLPHV